MKEVVEEGCKKKELPIILINGVAMETAAIVAPKTISKSDTSTSLQSTTKRRRLSAMLSLPINFSENPATLIVPSMVFDANLYSKAHETEEKSQCNTHWNGEREERRIGGSKKHSMMTSPPSFHVLKMGVRSRSWMDSLHQCHVRGTSDFLHEEWQGVKEQLDDLFSRMITDSESFYPDLWSRSESRRASVRHRDQRPCTRRGMILQVLTVLAMSMGHVIDGSVLAFTAPAVKSMARGDARLPPITPHFVALLRSSTSAGASVGCLLAGVAMGSVGRRGATLYLTLPFYFLGYTTIALSEHLWTILLGRLLTGVGLGLTLSVPTVYIVEMTNVELRGVLGVLPNLMCQLGVFLTYLIGHETQWHVLAALGALVCVPFGLAVAMLEESPTFLVQQGRLSEAERILKKLDLDNSKTAIVAMEEEVRMNNRNVFNTDFLKAINHPAILKPFVAGLLIMLCFQMSLFPVLIGDTTRLLSSSSSHVSTVLIGCVLVLSSASSVATAKYFGRKSLLIFSATGVTICLFLLALCLHLQQLEEFVSFHCLPLTLYLFYVAFFMMGFGSVSWLLFAELLPPSVRSRAFPVGICSMWLFNMMISLTYDLLVHNLSMAVTLGLYSAFSALGLIGIVLCVPETKERSQEQIAAAFFTS